MFYFSYGSNMSELRLKSRVPSAIKVATAILDQHRLRFHKISDMDGSAKCDAEYTALAEHRVYGVLYEIDQLEKPLLDRIEGSGYDQKQVIVESQGSEFSAHTYFALNIDSRLKPFDWYIEHVLRGARENALPQEYILEAISSVEAIEDPDRKRHMKELSIYEEG